MIIECQTCRSRFRLDESKVKGKGIRVRCRKCNEHIVVLKEAVSASPDSASDKKESLGQKSANQDSPPDNLIRFPKSTSHPATPAETEEKSDIDLAFEQLFKGAMETSEPEASESETAEPETAAAKLSIELPPFEPPTDEFKLDPPAELTFETNALPDFQAPVEKQAPDIPAKLPPDKPKPQTFQDESFDLASEVAAGSSAMKERQTQSSKDVDDFLKQFETQNLPDFQVSSGEQTFDIPVELPFEEPETSTSQDETLGMTSEAATEIPAVNEQQTQSFEDVNDFLKQFETQPTPDFQVSAEEQTFDIPAELPLEESETSTSQDEMLGMTSEVTTGTPVMNGQQAQSFEDVNDFLKQFETQPSPDFQVSEEKQALYMPTEFPFDEQETYASQDDAFDTAPEATADTPAIESQQAQSFEEDDFLFEEQTQQSFEAPVEEQALNMPFGKLELPSLKEEMIDMEPEVAAKPPEMKEQQAQSSEDVNDFLKQFETQPPPDFQAPTEKQALDMPTELPIDEPEPFTFEEDALDTAPEEMTGAPAMEEQQTPPFGEEEDFFSKLEAQFLPGFKAPAEKQALDMPTELPIDKPEPLTFEEDTFDTVPEEMTELPAMEEVEEQPTLSLEEDDDLFKGFETQMMQNFQAPKEEPVPDTPAELPLNAPELSAFQNESFDLASELATELPMMEQQQTPSLDEDTDFFNNFETQIMPNFQTSEEEEPTLDMPVDTQDLSVLRDETLGLALGSATEPLATTGRQAPSIGEHTDISMVIASKPTDSSIERTAFDMPDEAHLGQDASEMTLERNETPSYVYTPDTEPEQEQEPEPEPEPAPNTHEETPEQIYAATKPPKPSAKHAHGPSGSRFIRVAGAVLLLALLSAAGYYFGFDEQGRQTAGNISNKLVVIFNEKVLGKTAAQVSNYELSNVIGYYDSGESSQRIFVIRGQVTNLSPVGKSGIRIRVSLLDNTGNMVMEQTTYAGNVLPGAKLKTESRSTLESALANPLGEHLVNMDVNPGKTIPFMVLFFDAPENFRSYKIEANDNQ